MIEGIKVFTNYKFKRGAHDKNFNSLLQILSIVLLSHTIRSKNAISCCGNKPWIIPNVLHI